MKKSLLIAVSAFCLTGLFAEEENGHKLLYYKGRGDYWSGKAWAETSDGSEGYWQNDSIAVINAGNINFPKENPLDVYGIRWNNGNAFMSAGTGELRLGAGGISFEKNMGCRYLSGGNSLRLTASQTWSAVGERTISMNSSSYLSTSENPFTISAEDDVVLTLEGDLTWYFNVRTSFTNADVHVKSPALLSVTAYTGKPVPEFNARTLVLDGSSSRLNSSEGRASFMAQTLKLNNGGALAVNAGQSVGVPLDGVAGKIVAENGMGTLSGVIAPVSDGEQFPVEVAGDAELVLACSCTGDVALDVAGSGKCRLASGAGPFVFTESSLADFDGTVEVADGAVLAINGEVDFASGLILGDGAVVRLKLDRGDRIADWSKVAFPETGTVTLEVYRDDAIAAAEGDLNLGMDFSSVPEEDFAKIKIQVDDRNPESAYSVVAAPYLDGSGVLCAALTASMTEKNDSFGGMLWIGKEWADATVPENWVIYPSGTAASGFDQDNHPASSDVIIDEVKNRCMYMSASWKLDLKGKEWRSSDGRNNNCDGVLVYGISNGTWIASQLLLTQGAIEVEYGAVLKANGTLKSDSYWSLGTAAGQSDPFVFRVKNGGAADIGEQTRAINAILHNTDYIVDEGGEMRYYLKPKFSNSKRTRFENRGELVFPYGMSLVNSDTAVTGALEVDQKGGTLHLAGEFSLTRAEGAASACTVKLSGGTTVVSNDASFAGWDFSLEDGASAAVEIPADGDFSLDGFLWGENAVLEKKGDGILRFAVGNDVDKAGVKLSGGVLLPTDMNMAKSLSVEFSGGAIGVMPGVSSPYGLQATNGTITGTCRVRNLSEVTSETVTLPFLTVSAENDPQCTTETVMLERATGSAANGRVLREEITVDGVPCVRYSAEFFANSLRIIIR